MILRNNGSILVLAPALNIKDRDIDFMLNLLEEAISEASRRWKI
jgi:adenosylmethionine-8-amino-7-oxononanoate aminotransferase